MIVQSRLDQQILIYQTICNLFITCFYSSLFLADVIQEKPYQIPSIRPDPEKPNPKLGVGTILFSHNNKYMASKNGNYC